MSLTIVESPSTQKSSNFDLTDFMDLADYFSMAEESIFTKIIKGEIPSHKVYEDDHVLAFLDIHPVQPGMVLVVTKRQVEDFIQLEDDELCAWISAVQKVAKRLRQVFPDKKRIGVQIEGLDVAHVHAKLFPINSGDEFRAKPDTASDPDHDALAKIAEKLRF